MGLAEELRDFDPGALEFFRELYADNPQMRDRAIAIYKASISGVPLVDENTVYSELFTTAFTPPNLETMLIHAGNRLLPHLSRDEVSLREGVLCPYLYDRQAGTKIGRVVLRYQLIEDGKVKLPLSFRTQEKQPNDTDILTGVELVKDPTIQDLVTTAMDHSVKLVEIFTGTATHSLEPRVDENDKGIVAWNTSGIVIKPFTQEGMIFQSMLSQLDRATRDLAIEKDLPTI